MDTNKFSDKFRERLKKIIDKKIETTMIYPLSQFEMVFGEMWGENRPEKDLTEEQKVNRAKWKQCRNNILNMGNQQRRNATTEINMYTVTWDRYQTTFLPVEKFNANNGGNSKESK